MERGVSVSLLLSVFIGVVMIVILVGIVADSGADGFGVQDNFIATYNTPYTVSNDITTLNSLVRNNATWLDFDGISSYVSTPDIINFSQAFTISFWMRKPTAADTTAGYLSCNYQTGDDQRSWLIHTNTGNDLWFEVYHDGANSSNLTRVQMNNFLTADTWYHITAIYDGTRIYFFRNGLGVGNSNLNGKPIFEGTANTTLGNCQTNLGYYNGSIDEFTIYQRTIAGWEIRQRYNQSIYSVAKNGQRIPILSYHQVRNGSFGDTSVNTTDFAGQMSYLYNISATSITFGDYYNWTQGVFAMPKYPVIITFDDGFLNVYDNAKPIMDQYGFTGTLGIITDRVAEDATRMNWSIIESMMNDSWEIVSHSNGSSQLTTLTEAQRSYAFASSKQAILGNLSITPITFVYPGNAHNSTIDAECASEYTMCTGDASGDAAPFFTYQGSDITGGLQRAIVDNETGTGGAFRRMVFPLTMLLRWRMNENSGSTILDSQDNGNNNGFLLNTTWVNDSIDVNLAANEYTQVGRVITLTDSFIDPIQIRINYDYHSRYLGQFFIAIIQIVLALALLIFIYAMIRRHIE